MTRAQEDLQNAGEMVKNAEKALEKAEKVLRYAREKACLVCYPVKGQKARFHTCGIYK